MACSGMGFFRESSWSCFQSRLDSKLRWVWASIRPGSKRRVTEVDDPRPRGYLRARAGGDDAAARTTTTTAGVTTASAFPS